MRVALGGIFQNATRYLDRFITQYYSLLAVATEHEIEPIFVEGDSTDGGAGWKRLNEMFPGHVYKREHGLAVFNSVDQAARWMGVSYACDGVLEHIKPEHDALLWAEADLIWEPRTLVTMLERLKDVDMVCPLIMKAGVFYDTWAFSYQGLFFQPHVPFHPMLTTAPTNGLYPLDTGGSCWAVRGEYARKCRFRPPAQAMRSFCKEVRDKGGKIWLDPSLAVEHMNPIPATSVGVSSPVPIPRPVVNPPQASGVSVRSRRRVVQVR